MLDISHRKMAVIGRIKKYLETTGNKTIDDANILLIIISENLAIDAFFEVISTAKNKPCTKTFINSFDVLNKCESLWEYFGTCW